MSIEVRDLYKAFGKTVVCDNLNLRIPDGELVALLGPSGSGKTTLLRIMAGLEVPDRGSVLFQGEDATETDVRDRSVGFVFQHYALFNHLTIFENVAFGLRVRPKATRPPEAVVREKVMGLLKLVQLDWLAERYPHQLSGGQRQRIALARALAVEPKVLLLDEPFGALDAKVRKELRRWLRRLHDEVHVTSVFVTHDQDEAMEVADRVVVMNEGRIEQVGPPDEVYDRPANPFVLQFLGDVNLFHGRGGAAAGGRAGPSEAVYVRPHELEIVGEPREGALPATLSQTLTVGSQTRIEFKPDDSEGFLDVELPRAEYLALRERMTLERGSRVWLLPKRVTRFEEDLGVAMTAAASASASSPLAFASEPTAGDAIRLHARETPGFAERLAASVAILADAARAHAGRIVQASSLGVEDQVVTDLIARHRLPIAVATLATGRLHAETLALIESTERRYGISVERHRPQAEAVVTFVARHGEDAMRRSVELRKTCCGIRKLEPLQQLLAGRDAWITGLRRGQSSERSAVAEREVGEDGRVKLSPLAAWSNADAWHYVRTFDLPYNPLHDRFFQSIGCEPCTRATALGEDPRAGRWWWEQGVKECGLHTPR